LANLYSVIPSAEVIFSGIGKLAEAVAAVLVGFVALAFCWPKAAEIISAKNKPDKRIFFMFEDVYFFRNEINTKDIAFVNFLMNG
jgi:hypothetical protein